MKGNSLKDKNIIIDETSVSYVNSGFSGSFSSGGKKKKHTAKDIYQDYKITIQKSNEELLVFDFIGPDASIANALRRILIAEVPTMAIEKVFIENNTSVMQDEVLSHRLGLIPIKADPKKFEFPVPDEEPPKTTSLNEYNIYYLLLH